MNPLEYEERRGSIAAGLAERKLDGLLISSLPNVAYSCGFTGSNATILIWRDGAIFFTDPRYGLRAAEQIKCRVVVTRKPLAHDMAEHIGKLGLRRVGYEHARMTCQWKESVAARLPAKTSLVPVVDWLEQMRMVKSAGELTLIRRSVETNSRAYEETVPYIRAGTTEKDIAAELEHRMRRLGAERPAFGTIVATGPRTAIPHSEPGLQTLKTKELVMIDMGAMQDGYASDMTRMLYLGDPTPKVKHLYRAVLEAQLAAVAAVRPGVTAAHVHNQAVKVLKSHGLERAFTHSTGHGLGLEIHELPRVARTYKTRLQPGMVFTVEPGAYLEGFGGVRVEDVVTVTSSGCEVLTATSKELRAI